MSRYPDEEKRRRILQISYEAFGEIGYRGTTIKHIADRAGIAPGTVYTYFQDKDELFLSAITEIWDLFSQNAIEASQNRAMPYVKRATELFQVAEQLIRKSHRLLAGIFSLPERRGLLNKNLEKACTALVPFLEEGRKLGLRLTDRDPAFAYFQTKIIISGILWDLALVEGEAFEAELAQIKTVFFKELGNINS